MKELTAEEIKDYIREYPKRADRKLGFLLQNKEIVKAYHTPLGMDILKYLITEHEMLLDKIASLSATDEEKVRFRVLRDVIWRIAERIDTYNRQVEEVKGLKE